MRVEMSRPVYLCTEPTDLRKSINGLASLVESQLGLEVLSGGLFAFTNRSKRLIKILYWDRNGFCLWMKRLEKDRFVWPQTHQKSVSLKPRELEWLLEGLDFEKMTPHSVLHFEQFC